MRIANSFLDGIEPGEWSEEAIQKYLALSGEEEAAGTLIPNDDVSIREYRAGDKVEELIEQANGIQLEDCLHERYDVGVLEIENQIYGIIASRNDKTTTYIGAIAVDKSKRQRGLARDLIDYVDDRTHIAAKVSRSNLGAQTMFEKCGFSQHSIENGYIWMTRD